MVKLSTFIKNLLLEDRWLLYYLKNGAINVQALSEMVRPDAEKYVGHEVKQGAIAVAIKRALVDFEKDDIPNPSRYDNIKYDVVMKNNIYSINFKSKSLDNQERTEDKVNQFTRIVSKSDDFFNITESGGEYSIITSGKNQPLADEMFKNEEILSRFASLTAIVITFQGGFLETEGIVYKAIKRLFFENINVYEIFSTHNKLVFVTENQDAFDTYNLMQSFL